MIQPCGVISESPAVSTYMQATSIKLALLEEGRHVKLSWGVIRSVTHLHWWDDEALVEVEGFDQLHVLFWQVKVKHLQVLLDPGWHHAFRDTHDTPLHMPPAKKTDLSSGQNGQGLVLVVFITLLTVHLSLQVSFYLRKLLCLTWV